MSFVSGMIAVTCYCQLLNQQEEQTAVFNLKLESGSGDTWSSGASEWPAVLGVKHKV